MTIELIPSDLVIRDRVGEIATRVKVVPGDTVSFNYEGEKRTVLVLDNMDGIHLKGVAKERGAEFRNYLHRKITNLQYARPFVKQNVKVSYELLPDITPSIVVGGGVREVNFLNRHNKTLKATFYNDGSVYLNGDKYRHTFKHNQPLDVLVAISNFLSE